MTPWAAYAPKGAASLVASYTDLTGNGNNAGVGVAPAWDAVNGWKFDATNQYLTTTFLAQNDQSQSITAQHTNYPALANQYLCGAYSNTHAIGLYLRTDRIRYLNGLTRDILPALPAGNVCVAGNQGYRNGVAEGAAIVANANPSTQVLYIGALNNLGAAAQFIAAYIQALVIYDVTLTAPQVALITAAMAAL